jgi:hypothetical protein
MPIQTYDQLPSIALVHPNGFILRSNRRVEDRYRVLAAG